MLWACRASGLGVCECLEFRVYLVSGFCFLGLRLGDFLGAFDFVLNVTKDMALEVVCKASRVLSGFEVCYNLIALGLQGDTVTSCSDIPMQWSKSLQVRDPTSKWFIQPLYVWWFALRKVCIASVQLRRRTEGRSCNIKPRQLE